MAWRRFGLEIINESGTVMHDKYASNSREYMKIFQYISKVSFILDTSSFVSFWTRFKLLPEYKYDTEKLIVDI